MTTTKTTPAAAADEMRPDATYARIRRVVERLLGQLDAEMVQHLGLAGFSQRLPAECSGGADPMGRWVDAWDLSDFEVDLLCLAVLPELDHRFCSLFQLIQNPKIRRPTLGTAADVMLDGSSDHDERRRMATSCAIWRLELLKSDGNVPLFDRPLVPGPALADGFDGGLPAQLGSLAPPRLYPAQGSIYRREVELLEQSGVADFGEKLDELQYWIGGGGERVVALPQRHAIRPAVVAAALAGRLDRSLLIVDLPETPSQAQSAARQARLLGVAHRALVLLRIPEKLKGLHLRSSDTATALPILMGGDVDGRLRTGRDLAFRRVRFAPPTSPELHRIWARLLDDGGEDLALGLLANQRHVSLADMERAVKLARERAEISDAGVTTDDLMESLTEICGMPQTSMGRLRRPAVAWDRLVVGSNCRDTLEQIVDRVTLRTEVQRDWKTGPGRRPEGLLALLHGDSGTGKTLAAEALACRIGLPLLSVDLSRVVSKYIGETETHLAELFDACEGFRAVLFFDEADALFGKRTSTSSSHDRYANIEINFLLQRIERFEGLIVLSTNMLKNMDEAFARRLDFSIRFARPTPALRRRLWEVHLPNARIGADVDLDVIAHELDVVGGEIANIATTCAYMAAADRRSTIDRRILYDAVRQELVKNGRRIPGFLPEER